MKHWRKTHSFSSPTYSHLIYTNTNKAAKISWFSISKCGKKRIELKIFGDDIAVNDSILAYYNTRPAVRKKPWSTPGTSVFTITGGFEVEVGIHAIKATYYIALSDREEIRTLFNLYNIFYDESRADRYAVVFAQQLGFATACQYVQNILEKQHGESTCAFTLAEYYLTQGDLLSAVRLYALVPEENENYAHAYQLINQLTNKLLYKTKHGLVELTTTDQDFIVNLNNKNKSKLIGQLTLLNEEQKASRVNKIGTQLPCFIESGKDLVTLLELFSMENRMPILRYFGAKLRDIIKDDLQLGYIRSGLPHEVRDEFSALASLLKLNSPFTAISIWKPSSGGAEQQASKVAQRLLEGKDATSVPPSLHRAV